MAARSTLLRRLTSRGFLAWFLALSAANALVATTLLRSALRWSWVDAFYFVVTTLTTVGFGDLNVAERGPVVKLFVVYLMLSGAGSYSIVLALLVNRVVEFNLREFFQGRDKKMKEHVILCGLGNLGSRIYRELRDQGEEIAVIERHENRFVDECRLEGGRVLIADAKLPDVLRQAQIESAFCIVIATNDDLCNLEIALNARELNPGIRVVLRMYDQSLAEKMDRVFDFGTVLSASRIAAPSFANAVHLSGVAAQVAVHDQRHLIYAFDVAGGSRLVAMTCGQVLDSAGVSVLSLRRRGESSTPSTLTPLEAGDQLVVGVKKESLHQLLALNTPA